MRQSDPSTSIIGVLSDTHGLVRSGLLAVLAGVDLIVHAGDVGRPDVLTTLQTIAPVVAVRGNVDRGEWARTLPNTQVVQAAQATLYVLHDVHALDLDPQAAGFQAVISGHSHRPGSYYRGDILYLNPGSAGASRFGLPASFAVLTVRNGHVEHELIELPD